LAAALVLALVAGCGNDRSGPGPVAGLVGSVAKATVSRIQAKDAGPAKAAKPVTRADLEKSGKPILRLAVASRGLDGFLKVADAKGDVVTWTTSDRATFSFRNGVLIQTRGLGPDLMSADAPSVAELLRPGGAHQRRYFFLGDDDQGTRRTYDCTVKVIGRETIEVFERGHNVTHVQEDCARTYGSIKNEYWIEGSTIRRSRQWASARAGYVETEKVID
jgi:Group 4 capsule polysaccharide lipoprotein gfcB, YjbF